MAVRPLPTPGELYAEEIRRIYSEAERIMLEKVTRRLERGIDAPGWAEKKLAEVAYLNDEIQPVVASLQRLDPEIVAAIDDAYNAGASEAVAQLKAAGLTDLSSPMTTAKAAVKVLAADTVGALDATHARILREAVDVYRQTISEASAQVLTGTMTRRQAAQLALNRLTARGVTGFVDAAGRGWDLASYAEMAVRTGTAKATVYGRHDGFIENDYDLVIVSAHGDCCSLCRPWEGKVLSLTGKTEGYPSMATAEAAGLFHPNCRHNTSLYTPGLTKPKEVEYDPVAYEDRQKQRAIERHIRDWKRRQATALTDAQAQKAKVRVREWQAAQRAHIDAANERGRERHGDGWITLKRQYGREQIGKAH